MLLTVIQKYDMPMLTLHFYLPKYIVAMQSSQEETQRGASELLAIAAHTEGERAAMRAERDELEAARLRQVAAAEAQQRHLQEQADELRAVLEVRCSEC
jgi:hypothetical protein